MGIQVWRWGGTDWMTELANPAGATQNPQDIFDGAREPPWSLLFETEFVAVKCRDRRCSAAFDGGQLFVVPLRRFDLATEVSHLRAQADAREEVLEQLEARDAELLSLAETATSLRASGTRRNEELASKHAAVAGLRDEVAKLLSECAAADAEAVDIRAWDRVRSASRPDGGQLLYKDSLLHVSSVRKASKLGRVALEFVVGAAVPGAQVVSVAVSSTSVPDGSVQIVPSSLEVGVGISGNDAVQPVDVELGALSQEAPMVLLDVGLVRHGVGPLLKHICQFPIPFRLLDFCRPMRSGRVTGAWNRAVHVQQWAVPAKVSEALRARPSADVERAASCSGALARVVQLPKAAEGNFPVLGCELLAGEDVHVCFLAVVLQGANEGSELVIRSDTAKLADTVRETASAELLTLASTDLIVVPPERRKLPSALPTVADGSVLPW